MLLQSISRHETPAASLQPVIHNAPQWRGLPVADLGKSAATKVVASRWTVSSDTTREETAEIAGDYYTLGVALRQMDLAFSVDGRAIHSGRVLPGAMQVAGPGQRVRALFRGPCDALHLHISRPLLAECHEVARGQLPAGEISLADPAFAQDAVVERLGRALLTADDMGGAVGGLYADAVSLAIVTRLLGLHSTCGVPESRQATSALPKWRLKRAIDYIDANLGESVSLADIAGAVGLTRMYFAAQFRAATGLRPHEYVLRRRIEKAQDLMARSDTTLVEVAFTVGFQTQAHFSTVFKRFVGETPHQWRRMNRVEA